MENKYFKSFIKTSITFLALTMFLQLMSCEDDAILEPELIKECKPGESYCSLSLPKTDNYASLNLINPEIF